ncbi:hypothetical protein [Romboutsia sp.]|uniref:hypothetical protein n=1 Tax=Romboutsia sp. TaxID=1965302 RepID=UPI003F33B8FF
MTFGQGGAKFIEDTDIFKDFKYNTTLDTDSEIAYDNGFVNIEFADKDPLQFSILSLSSMLRCL